METEEGGDLYVRSGPGSIRLSPEDAAAYIKTRFPRFLGGEVGRLGRHVSRVWRDSFHHSSS